MFYDTRTHSVGALGYILMFLVVLLLAVAGMRSLVEVLDRPEVRVSYLTGLCVEVKDYKAEHEGKPSRWSCDHLPPSYERVWVE